MTLDEQIAWLADKACEEMRDAAECRDCAEIDPGMLEPEQACREHAATLLTIENTLRGYRDSQRPKMRNGDPIVVLVRPARRPRKDEQPQEVRATYIKRDRECGGVLVDIGGELRRVKHANIRRAA